MVLCAGAYGTPHLLLLSGVGPADHLTTFGIPVVADLPVGQGLQDHLLCGINYQSSEESLITAVSPANLGKLRNAGAEPLASQHQQGWRSQSNPTPGSPVRTLSCTAVRRVSPARHQHAGVGVRGTHPGLGGVMGGELESWSQASGHNPGPRVRGCLRQLAGR